MKNTKSFTIFCTNTYNSTPPRPSQWPPPPSPNPNSAKFATTTPLASSQTFASPSSSPPATSPCHEPPEPTIPAPPPPPRATV